MMHSVQGERTRLEDMKPVLGTRHEALGTAIR